MGPYKVVSKVGINLYKLVLPKGCRLYYVFHCDLLSRATLSTSLRPHQAKIDGVHEKNVVDNIYDVKIDNWPRRRGPFLPFFTHFVSFFIPEWMLLEQVDDCQQFSIFLRNEN